MPTYRVLWQEVTRYESFVEANDAETAEEIVTSNGEGACKDDYVEIISVDEDD